MAEVRGELVPGPIAGRVDALFRIKENQSVKVERVEVDGNVALEDGDLTKKMSNKPRGFIRSIFGGGHFDPDKLTDDRKAITDEYRKRGYLDAVILSDTVILNEDRTRVTIRVTVTEGPQYYFGLTTFTGMVAIPEPRLHTVLQYREGEVFNQERFEKTQEEIYNLYMEEGYLYVRLIEDTKTQDTVVRVSFEISEGIPAHVNRIDIIGNGKTKDKVIRRELAILPGQIFRRSALQRSLRNVMLLNYFSNVTPDFRQLPDGRVDLTVKVEEKPTGQIQVGGGYSETNRLTGTIDLGIPNLFGGGQSANLMLEIGDRRESYRVAFTEPWFLDTPTSVGLDVQRLEQVWDETYVSGSEDFTQRSTGATLNVGRRLRWPDDYFTVYWNYRWEYQKYTDFSDEYTQAEKDAMTSLANGVISSTALTLVRDSRDLPEFATRGSRASYQLELSGHVFGGDWAYTKHGFNLAYYRKIWRGLVFAPIWNFGVVQGNAAETSIPYSELYYAGGVRATGMIRGYDDRSILTSVDTVTNTLPGHLIPGDTIVVDSSSGTVAEYGSKLTQRGRAFFAMNAQITFPIVEQQIQGLLFYDAGNVWHTITDASIGDLYTSYGFGFRLTVPGVGMLGFDFGIPLRGSNKGKLKPHFQFGGSF
jgi:outer membrane protein insertion porin family